MFKLFFQKNLLICAATAVQLISTPVLAADELVVDSEFRKIKFDTSFRTRTETLRDFNFDGADQDFFLTQFRLGMTYKASDKTKFYIQLQDSRIFGEKLDSQPSINKNATPNIFEDQLDFHEAYIEHDFSTATVKLGRQKFNLGDKRLVASLEWVNTARVKDGVSVNFNAGAGREVEAFLSALVPVNPNDLNDQASVGNRYFDSKLHGVYVIDKTLLPGQTDYWYFYRGNQAFKDSIHTYGGRYQGRYRQLSYEVQASFQDGEFAGQDHRASMTHIGLTYPVGAGQLGTAYNFGSGDDDPTDSEHGTFDNLFPLNHAYYGFMDFFSLQNVHNLETAYTRQVLGKYSLRAALQGFWINEEDTDAWYNAGLKPVRKASGNVDSFAGTELDLTLSANVLNNRAQLIVGYSHFYAGSYIEDTGASDNASWYFLQFKFSPKI